MQIVAQSLQMHSDTARAHVNDRLADFESRIVEKFASASPEVAETFSDPDMQGALFDAQKAYVRTESEDLHLVLTDLIFRKAQETKQSRVSLVINDAITKSALLTKADFATVTLLFYILEVGLIGAITTASLALRFKKHLDPIWRDANLSDSSFDYLFSQGLILSHPRTSSKQANPLGKVLAHKFSEALNTGFTIQELEELTPSLEPLRERNLIGPCEFSKEKFHIKQTERGLDNLFSGVPEFKEFGKKYKEACRKKPPKPHEVIEALAKYYPEIKELSEFYDRSKAGLAWLTPAGTAIAHSYITSISDFDGALSLWIE